jgi:hypothetical protein
MVLPTVGVWKAGIQPGWQLGKRTFGNLAGVILRGCNGSDFRAKYLLQSHRYGSCNLLSPEPYM